MQSIIRMQVRAVSWIELFERQFHPSCDKSWISFESEVSMQSSTERTFLEVYLASFILYLTELLVFPVFSLGVGYGLIIGLGMSPLHHGRPSINSTLDGLFALLMTLTSFAQTRYFTEVQDSEMYLTTKRSAKAGMVPIYRASGTL